MSNTNLDMIAQLVASQWQTRGDQLQQPRWDQPKDVWINKPPEEHELALELALIQAV